MSEQFTDAFVESKGKADPSFMVKCRCGSKLWRIRGFKAGQETPQDRNGFMLNCANCRQGAVVYEVVDKARWIEILNASDSLQNQGEDE